MDILHQGINILLYIDTHLQSLIQFSGAWIYVILFLVIFCETGLVIFPFLPGDSLLFATGSLAAISDLNIHTLAISLCIAAILGDSVNYAIGKWAGPRVFQQRDSWLLNRSHLQKAHAFYQRYGNKTIVIARFIPIIRTFAPFVAGIGQMQYQRFLTYNIVGALLWICSFLYISFYFGNIPLVKQNFALIILSIIILSVLLPVLDYLRNKLRSRTLARKSEDS